MNKTLICSGLVLIPLVLHIGIFPFLPSEIVDYREAKETIALILALTISLIAFHRGRFRHSIQSPLFILLCYILAQPFIAPRFEINVVGDNVGNFWIYKPVCYALIYFLYCWAVANMCITDRFLDTIFKCISWTGFITACYLFIQALGLDQFQDTYQHQSILAQTKVHLTSTLTQTNYSGSFLALCLPFAFYLRYNWHILALIIGVGLTLSWMAAGMVLTMFLIYRLVRGNICIKWFYGCILTAAVCICYLYWPWVEFAINQHASGRWGLWQKVWGLIIKSPFPENDTFFITGYGLGAYRYLLVYLLNTRLIQVHNEPLEFFVNTGVVGFTLLILSIFWLIKRFYPLIIKDDRNLAIFLSFCGILFSALGLFVWQIEPHRFYTVTLIGLMYNRILKEGGNHDQKISNCNNRVAASSTTSVSRKTDD